LSCVDLGLSHGLACGDLGFDFRGMGGSLALSYSLDDFTLKKCRHGQEIEDQESSSEERRVQAVH
jgi:hypothetical protein